MAGTIKDRINNKVESDFRDLEVEYQLMAYVVRKSPPAVGMVEEEWLSDGILKDIHSVARALRIELSKAMLTHELKTRKLIGKGEAELYEAAVKRLYDVDVDHLHDKNVRHLMQQVLHLHESRRVLMTVGEIISEIKTFDLSKAKRKLMEIARPVALQDDTNTGYYLEDYPQRLEILETKKQQIRQVDDEDEEGSVGIPTGVRRFDKFSGGLMRKEFGVIAGVTGIGKTAGLICFGVNAWKRGYNVVLASGEMSKDLLGFRIDANLASIPASKFRLAELSDDEYSRWDSTIKKYETLNADNFLYVVTFPRKFDTDTIENEIVRVEEDAGRRIDMLCIDYLNIMGSARENGSSKEWTSQADAVWELKGLVAEHDIACWTAGQVKDEAFDKELFLLSDLKYARAISETAPVVIAFIQDDKDLLAKRMKLQILKMRNAPLPSRPIVLTPNMDVMRIHEAIRVKSLADLKPETLDVKPKTRKSKPKRNL